MSDQTPQDERAVLVELLRKAMWVLQESEYYSDTRLAEEIEGVLRKLGATG